MARPLARGERVLVEAVVVSDPGGPGVLVEFAGPAGTALPPVLVLAGRVHPWVEEAPPASPG